ncbi:ornithine carbamoyltransferase [Puniceicoccus vermicola]|uniref:Ornithine carbamoyltransferase n=1 Tax=Puniceicoccus vermicola TaxID=388746 RepID=A0A7X1AXW9_9BACT|nr:ornithine carbamoyltransferase [Puniceicoccus vermicola]MBC2602035.1 ornithine carbamoyltransferase [Puniceicoccus vermicola]
MRHFLKETDFSPAEIPLIFSMAAEFKRLRDGSYPKPLEGQSWGMIFYKNSTRTRISFEVGLRELGAHAVRLDTNATQISRGESIEDTAKVMGRYLHGLVIRTYGQEIVDEFAQHAGIPVVNALTDYLHPCQIYADVFTLAEKFGEDGADLASLKGRKLVFFGDCNSNMANSWVLAGALFGIEVVLCGPPSFGPGKEIAAELARIAPGKTPAFTENPEEAIEGADAVYTDVWVSMGDEEEAAARLKAMRPYSVTADLMKKAKPESIFLHCMPAHPGEEVTQEVLSSEKSVLFDEAENRLHMQKAILAQLGEWAKQEK